MHAGWWLHAKVGASLHIAIWSASYSTAVYSLYSCAYSCYWSLALPAEAPLEHNFRYPRIRELTVDNDAIALGGPAPFDTPTYRKDPISHCSIMPQSWNPLYTSHRHPKQPQNSKIALVTCP